MVKGKMKRNRPILEAICILLLAIPLLTACGGGEAGGKPSDASGSAAEGTSDSKLSAAEGSALESSHAGDSASGAPASSDISGSSAPEASAPEPSASESSVTDASVSEQPPADIPEGNIVVADFWASDGFLAGRVPVFAQENPSYGIQYVKVEKDSEKERMLMETVNGGGPDLLYVDGSTLENLLANEVLGEIGQLVSEENRDAMLPAALSMGTYEGKLFAVPLCLVARSLLTSRECWQGESWTVEDILSILEEDPGLKGIFLDMTATEDYFYNMYYLVGANIWNTPFLRDGESNFDCQEFRNVLETVKKRTKPRRVVEGTLTEEQIAPVMDGDYLGIECLIPNIHSYCNILDMVGDKGNLVGYPNDEWNGHYLSNTGLLAVNRNAMEKEGVRELVNDLLGLESQKYQNNQISVRADIPEAQLKYNGGGSYIWTSPNGNGFLLPAKEDGSSYLEEYMEFLKGAAPVKSDTEEVFDIVMEEADYYFDSDKELEEVVDTIQRRVALYMSERE